MAKYSVAEAKNRLPALIAAAERGEEVTITRYGKPVVEMRPARSARTAPRPMSAEDVARLREELRQIGLPRVAEDSVALVRQMREESEH
ncbi:MAG TPA: type II toxin-antitoxin system prevent-host-death family antitoxin [Acetobacteraceae bacterium]|nr:type II toxin-antitoxin system prevent-host-death family antitoxin [Acetobacteraceae bacterium]